MSSLSSEQKEQIKRFLKQKVGNSDHLQCLLLANTDGRLIAFSNFTNHSFEKNQLSAMTASLAGLNMSLAQACGKQSASGGVIESQEGLILTAQLQTGEQDMVLLGIFSSGCQQGMAAWHFKQYQRTFLEIFS